MKWGLFSLASFNSNSENIEALYKIDNFSIAIAIGVSLFVFGNLNTYFNL